MHVIDVGLSVRRHLWLACFSSFFYYKCSKNELIWYTGTCDLPSINYYTHLREEQADKVHGKFMDFRTKLKFRVASSHNWILASNLSSHFFMCEVGPVSSVLQGCCEVCQHYQRCLALAGWQLVKKLLCVKLLYRTWNILDSQWILSMTNR